MRRAPLIGIEICTTSPRVRVTRSRSRRVRSIARARRTPARADADRMTMVSAHRRATRVALPLALCARARARPDRAARVSESERASKDVALGGEYADGDGGFTDGFVSSLGMVLVSELGDETFIIAAIMAMRNSRAIVLAGGLSALTIMTVLSVMLGLVVPQLISKETVSKAAFVLYSFFGCRLLYIAYKSEGGTGAMSSEVEEVEEKLASGATASTRNRLARIASRVCTPVFIEAFVLIFLAEWGDRSQITTIALATHKNPYGVAIGGILGHCACTSLAVLGGRIVALKISPRTVSFVGGLLFFGFAIHALLYGAPGTETM